MAFAAIEKDMFTFDEAGIVLQFDAATKSMLLKQGGQQFTFRKD